MSHLASVLQILGLVAVCASLAIFGWTAVLLGVGTIAFAAGLVLEGREQ